MSEEYDVVVVGAGLGGLSAATSLAVSGRKVLLLERRNVPGGYASSFVKGRFEFEVSLHALSGVGTPARKSRLLKYLDALGMAGDVEFVSMPDIYRTVLPGLDVTLPADRDGYEQVLRETFPADREGISKFLARMDRLATEVPVAQGERQPPNPFAILGLLRYLPATWGQILDRDVRDPDARAVMSQLWGYFGPGPAQCSFVLFAMGLSSYLADGLCYVKGRSQHLSQAFMNRIISAGGEVKLSTGVERITTRGGRVTGIVTEHGERIHAKEVLANVPPVVVVNELLSPEEVPARFHASLRFRRPSPSSFNVYLGLDASLETLGLEDYEIFINEDANLDAHARRMEMIAPPGLVVMTNYNVAWKEFSPPSTTVSVLTSLMYAEPWLRIAPEDYEDRKTRVADSMLSLVERTLGVNLREYTEVLSISTPLTNARYTGTIGGALYGSQPLPYNATVFRVPYRGPLEGLWFTGAWTPPGGAYDSAIMGGRNAAKAIIEKGASKHA